MAQKDAWHAYVELALGLTDTSRKKAMKIVQQVAGKGGATADQLQDLVNQGMANREAMTRMIRVELDRALGRVGLATMDEVDELSRRVRELETELSVATTASPTAPAAGRGDRTDRGEEDRGQEDRGQEDGRQEDGRSERDGAAGEDRREVIDGDGGQDHAG